MTAQRAMAQRVADVLQASGVAEGRVYRARTRAISADTPHAVIVRLTGSVPTLAAVQGGRTEWQTVIDIECYGRAVGMEPDEVADQTAAQVAEVLDANPTLDGAAMDVVLAEGVAITWDFDELDTSLGCIRARFVVSHQTQGRTLNP